MGLGEAKVKADATADPFGMTTKKHVQQQIPSG
jgi:hypothetical protein